MTLGLAFDDVLAAARANAPWAFRRLFDDMAGAVAGYLRTQGAQDPDGLVNEVFLGAFSGLDRFEGREEQFRSWVFTIAHRRLTDDRRRRGRRPALAEGADVDETAQLGGDVEEEALRRLSTERVRALADALAPDQRDVVLLRMVGGLTVEQVAEAVGKSPTAVKALQRRALGALRRLFDRQGVSL